MFKNALISVSNKSGLVEFLKPLVKNGLRLVSTGGTAKYLRENGFAVTDVSEQTKFPEVMGGRVKTLHPAVHMCLLSRENVVEDKKILLEHRLQPFDLVICNLYPFEQTVEGGASDEEMIENIDIGGPSILRAAAKNHNRVTVVCDPNDYPWVTDRLDSFTIQDRRRLAAKVFAHVSSYDSLVAQQLGAGWGVEMPFAGRKVIDLRYGENPHQKAGWYRSLANKNGLHSAEILQGKPLSYNNILDLDAAASLVKEFATPTVVAVKHNNPCGVATHPNLTKAAELALKADPVSVFGGIVALNQTVDLGIAELLANIFLECVVAPDFSAEARQFLSKKKNLRILKWENMLSARKEVEIRSVVGGFLIQQPDTEFGMERDWKFLGDRPSDSVLTDLHFAEKICGYLKSNSIALVKNGQTLGLGMGQVNRVESVQHAVDRMITHHGQMDNVIMASDAFFPFPDSVEKAAKHGVKWILQPGGSVKDEEVFAAAEKLGIQMVITGTRHFRH